MIAGALAACLQILALAEPGAAPRPEGGADLRVLPSPGGHAAAETRCDFCHTAEDWKKISFSHDRTGFPLTGRHRDVVCSACHAAGDFSKPVARACVACHRDVHARRLSQRCDRCHDTGSFRQAAFGPDDHRRTAFPLTGRHAALPCEECHGNRRDRSFARPVSQCVGCHQEDYDRTAADPGLLDHPAAGFSTDCRGCHGAFRFVPAAFPAHEACFSIRSGPHAGIRCDDCHRGGIPPFVAGQPMTCSPIPAAVAPADCMACHGDEAGEHQGVPGYAPSNPRCYECHRFSSSAFRTNGSTR